MKHQIQEITNCNEPGQELYTCYHKGKCIGYIWNDGSWEGWFVTFTVNDKDIPAWSDPVEVYDKEDGLGSLWAIYQEFIS